MCKTAVFLSFFTRWWLLQGEEIKTWYIVFFIYHTLQTQKRAVSWQQLKHKNLLFSIPLQHVLFQRWNTIPSMRNKLLGLQKSDHTGMSFDWKNPQICCRWSQILRIVVERGKLKCKVCVSWYIAFPTIQVMYMILNSDHFYTHKVSFRVLLISVGTVDSWVHSTDKAK